LKNLKEPNNQVKPIADAKIITYILTKQMKFKVYFKLKTMLKEQRLTNILSLLSGCKYRTNYLTLPNHL